MSALWSVSDPSDLARPGSSVTPSPGQRRRKPRRRARFVGPLPRPRGSRIFIANPKLAWDEPEPGPDRNWKQDDPPQHHLAGNQASGRFFRVHVRRAGIE
jgi:hypothetical protein